MPERRIKRTDATAGQARRSRGDREDPAFDYSSLSPDFSKLPKPAQRAIMNDGVFTPSDLSRKTLREISALHGVGPSALLILYEALRKNGLRFKR